ncbi:MAG TPA: putative 2-aminoethylphosphonate ABC transporter permease subunit [Deltaproteobacteria bacterium]|nr:putative 2-aminoethylphosphonate ABC transporter permease subunit [Deltaproteobacteria bacterium]HIO61872.1 putative 2-aminoethylphosphonate ABC transporter permease subunit [Deltaproteobacteria bacterium]HIO82855.1 putative 2-aminoethylphosphonate ABC transporter permease subunit [Deltaproteobacteria bacterium]
MVFTSINTALPLRPKLSSDDHIQAGGLTLLAIGLLVAIFLPLYAMLSKSFQDAEGNFTGLANYREYFGTPTLVTSAQHTLTIGVVITVIVVVLAFIYAYALTRSCMPLKGFFRGVAMVPILAPSLLPAISLVYLFGNQGMVKGILMGQTIYGPIGIVIALAFWIFPHTVLILTTALSMADARLYEAAIALRASKLRIFFSVTLPGAKYGVMSACFVAFTYAITDFGAPKVIGGWYNVLSVDIYKQVVGQWNFQMGAVVSVVLLFPVIFSFIADRIVQRRQIALISSGSVPLEPKPNKKFDRIMLGYCLTISFILLGILAVSAYASFIKFWPYNLNLTLDNYQFDLMDGGGWAAYQNSIVLGIWTAILGTLVIFTGAYLIEKSRLFTKFRSALQLIAIIPLAVPGMVLGLAYIFFFNPTKFSIPFTGVELTNPFNFLYATMGILVICTITHYYTVPHLTAVTALKQMDSEFETVSASLKVSFFKTFTRVTFPVCLPAILDISIYLFVNAMTTVSAVVFLWGPQTHLASVAVLNMDDQGDVAPAAAMAMMIVYTSGTVRIAYGLLTRGIERRTQAWRRRESVN